MLIANSHPDHGKPLDRADAGMLGPEAAAEVERFLAKREGHRQTPLVALARLAEALGVSSIHIKDEGHRLGLGSFKALGGAYAVIRLIVEEASRKLGRAIDFVDFDAPEVREVASTFTVACATDGNHGRSVAQGARLIGARCVIFVHAGVSDERVAAIARYGAEMVRVAGNYDDSVAEAARIAGKEGWIIVSDTSWPGYERIPGLVMQGYTALLGEALNAMPQPPTHVFVQAGVGGIAAATAAYFALALGEKRPCFVVVDPARAACLFESARAGRPVKVEHGEATIMAMLECYEPSLVAWRVLSRVADAFMTVEDGEAVDAMKRLASPLKGDPAIVAGESGGVGLAALSQVARDPALRRQIGLDETARIFLINTEGATDPALYEEIVGRSPAEVLAANAKLRG
ncbi:diaminopropionate ammonia-lyase [Bosea sp. (in: a-proteobacteria)]|uniref:diaminopropionate ammonia-lyase n=1 Tax=Bosea sp. (in: a-proteobacteria) TaxID=1871050 RepID=UPI002634631C|nr:diaminopropionate ammonia-lyase [Bosea sp. (in: a-proteobacteria)]MCO5089535.1 diaminopropionate ammonia-lyase [Bosea sp. (in: a-proteobacteria)]